MNNLNLFEVLQTLAKNHHLKAVSARGCIIQWKEKQYDGIHGSYKQLVFINLTKHERTDILTDVVINQQNENFWRIEAI